MCSFCLMWRSLDSFSLLFVENQFIFEFVPFAITSLDFI